jgi:hypothetical protein
MTAWAHRYSEPLLWLVSAAVVIALSGVPRCAWAGDLTSFDRWVDDSIAKGPGPIRRVVCETCTATVSTTDATWSPPDAGVVGMVALADHRHPLTPGCLCPDPPERPLWWFLLIYSVGLVVISNCIALWIERWRDSRRGNQ